MAAMLSPQQSRWAFKVTSASARCINESMRDQAAALRLPAPGIRLNRRALSSSSTRWAGPKPRRKARGGSAGILRDAAGAGSPGEGKQTLSQILEKRKVAFVGLGLAAAVMGGYVVMLAMSMTGGSGIDDAQDGRGCCAPSGRPLDLRQGRISAIMFDRDLNRPESLMGVTRLRKLMGGLARGHVLEVAVGTGRNIEYVDWDEIRACAPPVPQPEDGGAVRGEQLRAGVVVKTESELEKERVRRRLVKGEKGLVLPGDEAPEVLSYTGVDVSMDVLEVAWGKLKSVVPELIPRRRRKSKEDSGHEDDQQHNKNPSTATTSTSTTAAHALDADETLAANIGQGRIRLFKNDAQLRLPQPPAVVSHDSSKVLPAPPYYDTIMQNFGLCSVSDPHALLANMAAVLRPGSGRIYLLEHGRGSYGWLNRLLDRFAPSHFERYGCWWNRDIEDMVRRAEREVPGLEVVRIERPLLLQGGTMLWIELRVNADKPRVTAAGTRH